MHFTYLFLWTVLLAKTLSTNPQPVKEEEESGSDKIPPKLLDTNPQPEKEKKECGSFEMPQGCIIAIFLGLGVGMGSMFALSPVLHLVGFGAAGVSASSFAAWAQSIIGGNVVAGSAFALLQSIGAAGFGFQGAVIVTGGSAALGYTLCKALGFEAQCSS